MDRDAPSGFDGDPTPEGDALSEPDGGRPSDIELIGDRYRVVELLGRGATGRTLLCEDRRDGLRVAVKELQFGHLEDWKQLELFEREAAVLSRIDHPGIPKVLEFFRGDGDATKLYIVQELIEGRSLAHRIDDGPMLGVDEVRDLTRGLLEVLEYLHGRIPPVLHRDIKPANVIIRPDGRVALVDFGGVWAGWRAPEQMGSTVVGTFGYMPPEQLVGQATPASDLYALGATLLHVLSGRPPGEFPFDSGRIEVPEGLPGGADLHRLVGALLRPAPRDRPQTADAARRVLEGAGDRAGRLAGSISVEGERRSGAASPAARGSQGPTRGGAGVPSPREPGSERLAAAGAGATGQPRRRGEGVSPGSGPARSDAEPGALEAQRGSRSLDPALARRNLSVPSDYGPRFVDMGPPPRDPEGRFRDVYSNLVNPLFPERRTWGMGAHAAWLALALLSSVVTLGILPMIYVRTVSDRIADYEDVFRNGRFTRGVIRSVDKGSTYANFRYEFEANGELHVAIMTYAQEMTRFWNTGDPVPVLYDPEDPSRSCFVYR